MIWYSNIGFFILSYNIKMLIKNTQMSMYFLKLPFISNTIQVEYIILITILISWGLFVCEFHGSLDYIKLSFKKKNENIIKVNLKIKSKIAAIKLTIN